MKNKKRLVLTLASTAVIIIATVGTTLALLSDKTEERKNVFTMAGMSGVLREPLFNGDDDADDNFVISANQVDVPADSAEWGENLALEFVPGRVIPKDPAVENTSENVDAYVAVTVEYMLDGNDSDYNTIFGEHGFATVDLNVIDWEWNDDKTVAYYIGGTNGVLPAESKTSTLFNKVTIKTTAKEAVSGTTVDIDGNTGVADFDIVLNGYLTQSEGVTDTKTAMKTEFGTVFTE